MEIQFEALVFWVVFVTSAYHLSDWLVPRVIARFRALSKSRRRYVTKNVLKSFLLLVLSIISTGPMYRLIILGDADNLFIHTAGLLYAFPDLYALWWAKDVIQRNTVQHHLSVGLLALLGLFQQFERESHWYAMLVYAYLSMLTGVVNFYLGVRFLLNRKAEQEDRIRRLLAKVALIVYVMCCAVNWTYQGWTLVLWMGFRRDRLTLLNWAAMLVYCVLLYFIIADDLILMRKLNEECKPYKETFIEAN